MATDYVTTTQDPWAALQPYLKTGFAKAGQLLTAGGPQYYPNSTVAQFGQNTQDALGMMQQQATAGNQVAGPAGQQIASTLQGDYLNSNPYLDAMYNQAAQGVTRNYQESVAPTIAANFGLGGRTGSNMAFANAMDSSRQTLADSLGGMAANIYGGNYQQERARQMQAAGLAPQTAELGYYDADRLLGAGQIQDEQSQRNISDQFNRYMYNQERPYDALGRYMGYLGGNYGGSTTQPVFQDTTARNLGLAGAGLGLISEFGGGAMDFLRGLF